MKKTFLLPALLVPCSAFAQSAPGASSGASFIAIIIVLAVMVGIFILCRELFCWYWKVNKMVQNQDEIIRLLKKIADEKQSNSNTQA